MRRARRIGWPLVALGAIALIAILRASGALDSLQYAAADARSRLLQHEVPSDIVIVGIDARTLAQLPQWPWPRELHARLLDTLASAAPRRVFMDIDFSSARDEAGDARLEAALAAWGANPVVLPAFIQPASGADEELALTRPLPRFERY